MGILSIALGFLSGNNKLLFILSVLAAVGFVITGAIFYAKLTNLFHELEELHTFVEEAAAERTFIHRPPMGQVEAVNAVKKHILTILSGATDIMAEKLEKEAQLEIKEREAALARELQKVNARLSAQVTRTRLLLEVVKQMVGNLELPALLDSITRTVSEILGYREFAILLCTQEGNLRVVSCYGMNERIKGIEFHPREGVSFETVRTGKPIYIPDTHKEPRYLFYKGIIKDRGSLLSLPIIAGDTVVGVMNFHSSKVDAFTEEDIETLVGLGTLTGIAIQNAHLFEKLRELSSVDDLTGVFNRRVVMERLREEISKGAEKDTPVSVLMIDFDNFKKVNDDYGHLVGDAVLKECVQAIRSALRQTDIMGRYGGDEFLVVMPGTNEKGASSVADRIKSAVSSLVVKSENYEVTGLSVTIAQRTYRPSQVSDVDTILRDIDTMLIRMKKET